MSNYKHSGVHFSALHVRFYLILHVKHQKVTRKLLLRSAGAYSRNSNLAPNRTSHHSIDSPQFELFGRLHPTSYSLGPYNIPNPISTHTLIFAPRPSVSHEETTIIPPAHLTWVSLGSDNIIEFEISMDLQAQTEP